MRIVAAVVAVAVVVASASCHVADPSSPAPPIDQAVGQGEGMLLGALGLVVLGIVDAASPSPGVYIARWMTDPAPPPGPARAHLLEQARLQSRTHARAGRCGKVRAAAKRVSTRDPHYYWTTFHADPVIARCL